MAGKSPYTFHIPEDQKGDSVKLWKQSVAIPTYEAGEPDKNPMFFEKRVYQGSSGKVYPLPYIDRVSDEKTIREYEGLWLENEYVRFLILPELGGRIQLGQDKTNDDYDFFYRNDVIKPALVGLAGPWISGGVEFNWPQHHRPATYMPVEYIFDEKEDGSKTVWLSDHDPVEKMKGMIGLTLRPGSSVLEAKVRLYNRTEETKTFLWWANVAAEVHDSYQSFFPPDVSYVADHAARAMTEFPLSRGEYYGIDYAPGTDISMYKNIPVPTSYMVVETEGEFFGGYDYSKEGGFVHVANRHISPGKKQWTWGNADFGRAWDRNLTDDNGPYVELMAGVYTNNQPDFTYLLPGETKVFSQMWYPIRDIGVAHQANLNGAVHLSVGEREINLGVTVTSPVSNGSVILMRDDTVLHSWQPELAPGSPFIMKTVLEGETEGLTLQLVSESGKTLIEYTLQEQKEAETLPDPAKETPAPEMLKSTEELYLAGEHLKQYRHPTRYPEDYWLEALRRDPLDIRCNTAMGQYHLGRFEYESAERHFRKAIERLTAKHPNPVDGESYYGLGMSLKQQNRLDEAYAAFYKATWNYTWRAPGYFEAAKLDSRAGRYGKALEHLEISINHNNENLKAHTLRASLLRHKGRFIEALNKCREILDRDPLYLYARYELILCLEQTGSEDEKLNAEQIFSDVMRGFEKNYTDTAWDYISAGLYREAEHLLNVYVKSYPGESSPFPYYCLAYLGERLNGDFEHFLIKAANCRPDYFFPSTGFEEEILNWAAAKNPDDASAPYYLGNLYYDKKRKSDAVRCWEKARDGGSTNAVAYRNLGIAYYNFRGDAGKALDCYEKALSLAPEDGRILFELDQLKKKMNIPAGERKAFLERFAGLVSLRDDLSIEMASLHNLTGEPEKALEILESRNFHPWEGGEGQVVGAWSTALLSLGEKALARGDYGKGEHYFKAVLDVPENLGETWHPLQNQGRIFFSLGKARQMGGDREKAREYYLKSSETKGDFSAMAVQEISEMTFYTADSLDRLGRKEEAEALFRRMIVFGETRMKEKAQIDYFATSLPLLLVFDDDIQLRSDIQSMYIMALGHAGLGDKEKFEELKKRIITQDAAHPIQLFHWENGLS